MFRIAFLGILVTVCLLILKVFQFQVESETFIPFPFSDPSFSTLSLHPPHLTDTNGLPALIPFCAYGGNMKILGEHITGLDFPVCNAFEPKIIDGEPFYALDLKALVSNGSMGTKTGRGNGLLLAIDNGNSVEPLVDTTSIVVKKDFIRTELVSTGKRARLHILTSHVYEDSRPGVYTMKNLKQMSGTDNFLAMADDVKKCHIEREEDCRGRLYLQEVQKTCGCLPWSQSNCD